MARIFALVSVLVISGLLACATPRNAAAAEYQRGDWLPFRIQGMPAWLIPPFRSGMPRTPQYGAPTLTPVFAPPGMDLMPAVSATVRRAGLVAEEYGDRFFLVVDKVHGKIALFENGRPVFVADALTGQNTADFMPADVTTKTYAQQTGLKYKVTPAGRFTVSVGFHDKYGELLDINEMQGWDWALAIHQVALRNSQHRDLRLRSTNDDDKHITDGCVDVDLSTIRHLIRVLGRRANVPIYILPMNETLFPRFFPSRVTASARSVRAS
jgi:hypothetical protein